MKKVVEKLDDFGRGIVYVDNKITFIPKCIPGDTVDFVITDEHSKYFTGKLNKIVDYSSNHIKSMCPFYEKCGGCSLQNLSYEETLKFKKEKITNLFKRNKLDVDISIVPNPKPYNYRNKVSLKIKDGLIGFYEEDSHIIVEVNECLLAQKSINKTIKLLPLLNLKEAEITIRTNYLEEILIIIDTKEKVKNIPEIFAKEIRLKGIIVNNKVVYGAGYFEDVINDIKYEISYNSFFQVNPHVASLLFNEVEANINSEDIVYDLYSGVGAFSLVEAKKANRVIGIEIVKNAVINATKNKDLNNIKNVEFLLKDLAEGININDKPTCVVVDPPRSGIDKKTRDWLIKTKPQKIIYISCDPNTLVRDLKMLSDYSIKKVTLFDMFSYTYHLESITVLERKESRV